MAELATDGNLVASDDALDDDEEEDIGLSSIKSMSDECKESSSLLS